MSDFIAYAGDRTWKHCESVTEATEWLAEVGGGRLYVTAERLVAAEQEIERLRGELLSLSRTADTLRRSCIDAENQLHGIKGAAMGTRTVRDIERCLETMRDEAAREAAGGEA